MTFTRTAGAGTVTNLPATVASGSGTASRSVTGVLAGSITVTATSSGLTAGATTFTVMPGAAHKLAITSPTTTLTSGVARTLTAKMEDAAGNLVTNSNRLVTFTKSTGAGTVSGLPATVVSSGGLATKSVIGALAGSITITATATALSSATTTFTVVHGAAKKLVFTSPTASLVVGQTRTLIVKVEDAAGNLVPSPAVGVTFTKISGSGTVSGLPATVGSVTGVASRAVKATGVGSILIKASSGTLTAGTTSFTITH